MESILAQSICLSYFLVDCVCAHGFRNGVVEGGVKKGDTLDFGKLCSAMTDNFQCGKVVAIS
jgi:hypothetical protein